ncbi:MAG TPA: VWA domain-containing protein [Candidatus Dormibacteraeota bacterium]|nr:VWA domain-containing protein [Candidatus Dormibacteraeota bacterium]
MMLPTKSSYKVAAGPVSALLFLLATCAHAQTQQGPIAPKPGVSLQTAPQDKQSKVVVNVHLVSTPVTVRDAKGEMVVDLAQSDFQVYDNGVQQRITSFELGGESLSLVLLVENSSRIEPILPAIRKTGIVFTQTVMGPTGEAAVLEFNDTVDKRLDFTKNADTVEKTVGSIRVGTSGAKLYDALSAAVEMLASRSESSVEGGRRRIILALSEAVDTGSASKLGEVLHAAQRANVTIYSVGLSTTAAELRAPPKKVAPEITPPGTFGRPPIPGTVQTPTTEAQRDASIDFYALAVWLLKNIHNQVSDHALEAATVATGGVHLSTFKDRSIEKAMDQIGGELHAQYNLSYAPSGTEMIGYHEIKIEIMGSRKGLKWHARPGYYLAEPQG